MWSFRRPGGSGTQLASSDVVKSMYFDTMNKYTAPIPI